MDNIPSNVAPSIVGNNCLFVNTGLNAEKIPIINTNINATIMFIKILQDVINGGIPKNNTENNTSSTIMKNPLVKYTIALYFEAYSMYGPSITSDLALIIENGYSFKIIIYPMKNTMAAIIPDAVNKNGPLAC